MGDECINVFDHPVTSAEEREHILDGACWCGPDLALAELLGGDVRVVTHHVTYTPWPPACPIDVNDPDDPRLCTAVAARLSHRRQRPGRPEAVHRLPPARPAAQRGLKGDNAMSWSVTATTTRATLREDLEAMFTAQSDAPDESREAFDAAVQVAQALVDVVGGDELQVSVHGHAHVGHEVRDGWTVGVSIQ